MARRLSLFFLKSASGLRLRGHARRHEIRVAGQNPDGPEGRSVHATDLTWYTRLQVSIEQREFNRRCVVGVDRFNGYWKDHRAILEDTPKTSSPGLTLSSTGQSDMVADAAKRTFLDKLCTSDRDTHFYVGTILAHPKSWVVIGVYWPPKVTTPAPTRQATRTKWLS